MANLPKYLLVLESLKLSDAVTQSSAPKESLTLVLQTRLEENLSILTKYIKVDIKDLVVQISNDLHVPQLEQIEKYSTEDCYCIYLEHILLYIINNVNFNSDSKEDLISSRHLNLCIEAIQDLANLALHQPLHPLLRSHPIFGSHSQHNSIPNYVNLHVAIAVFARFLGIKQFHLANSMEGVVRDYIGGIFTFFIANELQEHKLTEEFSINLQEKLNLIWSDISQVEYFRNILFLKGIKQLPSQVQKRLHQELLNKLLSKNGFTTLVATLLTAQLSKEDAEHNNKQTFEIIANIVAFKGHSKRFQSIMLRHILKFINLCVLNESMMDSMGAGLLPLRRLYDLNEENQVQIKVWLHSSLKQLIQPEDLLSGLILMEQKDFCNLVSQLYHIFCTSSVECLPSEILIFYLPLLMQLFYALPENFLQKNQIQYLITRCLSNRTPKELYTILGQLYKGNFDDRWIKLHDRILIYPNPNCTDLNLKIASSEHKQENIIAVALPELLLTSDHNILAYQVFMSLLQHMNDFLYEDDDVCAVTSQIDLLQTQEELITFLNNKYPVKIDILLSLNTLISHDGLKNQLIENCSVFMNFLRQSIEKRASISSEQRESADQTLLIMLTLAQEILEFTQIPGSYADFIPILKILKAQTPNQLIKQRIDCILVLLLDDYKPQNTGQQTLAPYNVARSLIESKESHLQVYGIQMLLDLLRRRDAITMSNTHVIIALALATLKHKESYTFLNCVRLFVGLTDIMEAEVLEVLSDEYLNDNASIDFRLIVGEAIVKVSKELGPICYKYKDVLLNCFMHGARSSTNEFRWSSFSNLSQLCRILCYQVHKFFNELINLIDHELTTGKYLPAQRAAVLILAELLEDMENLFDFEEMLLPLYKVLTTIETDADCDQKMRIHAANGLKTLSEKCKSLLFPQQELQKDIRILGIKEKSNPKTKNHILEIN